MQKVCDAERVQFAQAALERIGFVPHSIDVPLQIQQRQFGPGAPGQKIGFALVEAEFAQSVPAMEILLGVPLSVQEPHHMVAPRDRESAVRENSLRYRQYSVYPG